MSNDFPNLCLTYVEPKTLGYISIVTLGYNANMGG